MNARRLVPLILVLLLSLVVLPAATGAQDGPPQPAASPQAIPALISPLFSYQGRLVEGGAPVTGNRDMTFSLWTASTLGDKVWNEGPKTVSVSNGLFTVTLGDTTLLPMNWFAHELWLEVQIGATTLPRQRLMGAPYAMSLAPGAHMLGSKPSGDPAVVTVENASSGAAIKGYSSEGWGVYAESGTGSAINAANNGSQPTLKVSNTSTTGAAVQVDSNGSNYTAMLANAYAGGSNAGGVLRLMTNGGRVLYAQNKSFTPLFTLEANGDVTQNPSAGGLVKVAIAAHCGNGGYSTIDRYFTSGTVPAITNGTFAGTCSINTGIDLSTRYWTITPTGGVTLQFVNCDVDNEINQQFNCFLADADDRGMNSTLQILIY